METLIKTFDRRHKKKAEEEDADEQFGIEKKKNLGRTLLQTSRILFFLNVSSHRFISIFHGWPARSLNDYESTFTFCLFFFPFFFVSSFKIF